MEQDLLQLLYREQNLLQLIKYAVNCIFKNDKIEWIKQLRNKINKEDQII